jgi:hypothetical protein
VDFVRPHRDIDWRYHFQIQAKPSPVNFFDAGWFTPNHTALHLLLFSRSSSIPAPDLTFLQRNLRGVAYSFETSKYNDMKNRMKSLFMSACAGITYYSAVTIIIGLMMASCSERVCHTYDSSSRSEIRRSYSSTNKHSIRNGYSIIKRRKN